MWIREADFRVGIYTYTLDDISWLVIGLLAFQIRMPNLKGRYGFLITAEASWFWWGRKSSKLNSPAETELVSRLWMNSDGQWVDNHQLLNRSMALEGNRRCGRFGIFSIDVVSIRKVVTHKRWLPFWKTTRHLVNLRKVPKRKGFHETMVYELRKSATLSEIQHILHKDKRVIRAMELSDDLCTYGYLRECGGLRSTNRGL